jgi:hypothetical protein
MLRWPKASHFYNILSTFSLVTAGNWHKQNSWFCKEIREDNFRCWWRRVHEDASQGMYMSKIEIFFLKIMEPRPIGFKEWRDTRTFSNLKSTHCTLIILLIINLVTKKYQSKLKIEDDKRYLHFAQHKINAGKIYTNDDVLKFFPTKIPCKQHYQQNNKQ